MRSPRRILPVAIALLLSATAFAASGSVPAGWQVSSSSRLAGGVEHEALSLADPAQSVHVARVAPGAARFVAVSSHDAVAHQDVGGELPSAMCRRVGCYAGVNADFFDAGSGEPVGGVVSGGRLVRSPIPGRAQLNVGRDGRLSAGPLDWSGSVTGNGRTVALTGVNVPYRAGDVVLYTPAWAGPTPEGADTELIVKASGAVGALGAATPLEITGVRSDRGPIPAGGAVLAASGSASATLQEFAAGGNRALELRVRTSSDIVESVGGSPVLLRNGQFSFPDTDDSFTRSRHPRSLVGWNGAGEVVLVTVDGGREGASGMTLAEAADLLLGLGATEGFGFNNGAATFIAAGEVQNRPVDDVHPDDIPTDGREVAPGHFERPAANAFMVVPRPADVPPGTNPGANAGSGTKPGPGGSTATTSPGKLTTAGGGPAPAAGTPAAPGASGATTGTSVLPGNVSDILKNPATKRPRRHTDKTNKGKKSKGGEADEEEFVGDPSIPDWNDITAALTPEQVAAAEDSELSLGVGAVGADGTETDYGLAMLRLIAAGMIGTVLWGLRRAHDDGRRRSALWY